ncbi:membrane hypothetical protein [Gammaproteobacteria bacterium]
MTYYFYIVQVIAILFAVTLAKHNAPAVIKFADGVSNKLMAVFHRYNWFTKFFFCLLASAIPKPFSVLDSLLYGGISFAWIYLLFDIVLNKNTNKRWYYLGQNDADGRFWLWLFKKKAGKIKAVSLTFLIIILNILYELTN